MVIEKADSGTLVREDHPPLVRVVVISATSKQDLRGSILSDSFRPK